MKLETLEACISDHGREIYGFCLYLTRSRQEAEDLFQDTFLKAVEREERLDPGQNLRAYLCSIAVNLWSNRRRKAAWRRRIAGEVSMEEQTAELVSAGESPEERMVGQEEEQMVRRAVQALPDKYRIPVLLFYMEEMPVSQIAGILRLPESTVKTRLHRARKRLEKELEAIIA